MTRVAILGATGYTALELIKLLLRHPQVEIVAVTSRSEGNPHIASVHPQLAGRIDLRLEDVPYESVARRAECVFCCLPHGVAAAATPQLLSAGARVVDFSADYRLKLTVDGADEVRVAQVLSEIIALLPAESIVRVE